VLGTSRWWRQLSQRPAGGLLGALGIALDAGEDATGGEHVQAGSDHQSPVDRPLEMGELGPGLGADAGCAPPPAPRAGRSARSRRSGGCPPGPVRRAARRRRPGSRAPPSPRSAVVARRPRYRRSRGCGRTRRRRRRKPCPRPLATAPSRWPRGRPRRRARARRHKADAAAFHPCPDAMPAAEPRCAASNVASFEA
jgi:hypothetical protein